MKKIMFYLLTLLIFTQNSEAQNAVSHSEWTVLLQKYVSATGKVDYQGFKSDKKNLDAYLGKLRENSPQSSWSKNQKIAYWVNIYNAFTIQKVVEKYPNINSILDLENGKVWTTATINIANKDYTLDQIEKEILIKELKEPRVHFAVNCAANSCPPLWNKAWEDSDLDKNLDTRSKEFLNNKNYNLLTFNELRLSKIFEWYAADFGNVFTFIRKYSKTAFTISPSVKYQEYDWKLNKK